MTLPFLSVRSLAPVERDGRVAMRLVKIPHALTLMNAPAEILPCAVMRQIPVPTALTIRALPMHRSRAPVEQDGRVAMQLVLTPHALTLMNVIAEMLLCVEMWQIPVQTALTIRALPIRRTRVRAQLAGRAAMRLALTPHVLTLMNAAGVTRRCAVMEEHALTARTHQWQSMRSLVVVLLDTKVVVSTQNVLMLTNVLAAMMQCAGTRRIFVQTALMMLPFLSVRSLAPVERDGRVAMRLVKIPLARTRTTASG
jgi:hypothetical protein